MGKARQREEKEWTKLVEEQRNLNLVSWRKKKEKETVVIRKKREMVEAIKKGRFTWYLLSLRICGGGRKEWLNFFLFVFFSFTLEDLMKNLTKKKTKYNESLVIYYLMQVG